MTLIKNFNTGVTLLSDKWNFCHWTQPTTFIETLGSIQTRYRERPSHSIIQRKFSDIILGWRQSLTNLLFCYLKCFLRVIASRKKVDLCKTKIKVRWKIMLSISVEYSLCKKSSNTEFFFARICSYSVQMWENSDQKKLRVWTLFAQWLRRYTRFCKI